ncbi:tetratricopeptide repeat protein [Paramicrobacterium agarici]|uniref:Tetratricopeptide repeat protein n=1 Tax=Paramicrobacterium agarici TaxID=630514 RepID=A0A2A9E1W1_9MICO|nr:tetratricopeptide repeat protein [Microbacterium agarici]PFG29107.1 tetratricopeptide repeat protein [Microbacterium agarici]PFG32179.1 tetratricopeptide repeat protein [Microbacterium agarici]
MGYDAASLREKVDLKAVGERLDELGNMRSLEALCEKAWLLKVAGQLDDALDAANAAVRLARFTGNRRDLMRPRMLRAQVLQFRAEFEPALHELNSLIEEAHTHEWMLYEAFALQHRGKVYFDQKEYELALEDFRTAVQLRRDAGASEEQIESSLIAIRAAESHLSL